MGDVSSAKTSEEARWLGVVAATAGVAGAIGVVGAAAGAGFVTLLKRQAAHARDVIGKPLQFGTTEAVLFCPMSAWITIRTLS